MLLLLLAHLTLDCWDIASLELRQCFTMLSNEEETAERENYLTRMKFSDLRCAEGHVGWS